MLLSIIIPTFNEEAYLPGILVDLQKQTFRDFELIVSDGNSEDDTRNIAHTFSARVISNNKKSPAIQRNEGAKVAKGEIFLFLDADTRVPDQKFLEKAIHEFQTKNLDVAGFIIKWDGGRLRYRLLDGYFYMVTTSTFNYFFKFTSGAAIMVKQNVHQKINGFDTHTFIGEDVRYGKKSAKVGKFGILASVRVNTSVRRFEEDGYFQTLGKWSYAVAQGYLSGKVDKRFEYRYGKFKRYNSK